MTVPDIPISPPAALPGSRQSRGWPEAAAYEQMAESLEIEQGEISFTPTEKRYDQAHESLDTDTGTTRPPQSETNIVTNRQGAGTAAQGLKLVGRGQGKFAFDGEALKETLIKTLLDEGETGYAAVLQRCHTERTYQKCHDCRKVRMFYNRCENFYCPCCARRLASDRRKSVEWWATHITQGKHVVVTVRNTETITKETVQRIKRAWSNLRRKKFASNWRGGFYALEVTNEGKGWHIHIHALVNASWIDARELAKEWAKCIGQDFAIVKVKDARAADYLRELCKYIADGNQLASWSGPDLVAYIRALDGVRTFGCFGSLYKLRTEHRAFLDSVQSETGACPCGCTKFKYYSEQEWEYYEATNGPPVMVKAAERPAAHPLLTL